MKLISKLGFCIFFLVFIIATSEVHALGIAPARKIVDFDPGLSEKVNFEIVNTESKAMKVFIYAEGEYSEVIKLNDYELTFAAGENSKKTSYEFKLPNKIDKPGEHDVKIVIREVPLDYASEGTIIGGTVAVSHQFKIKVPYPGKYAVADLKIAETGKTDEVKFIVSVNSLGTQKIVNAKGIIDIFGPTNEKLATVETNLDSVDSGLRKDLVAIWDGDINPGKYYAKLTLTYDGEVAYSERVFDVGTLDVEVVDINVKDFKLGEIAKFNILVDNTWADGINEIYVELIISENGEEIGKFKSASENIEGLSKGELTAFWDTAGVEEGSYDAKIVLYYGDKTVEKNMKTVISLNNIEFDLFAGAVVARSGGVDKSDVIVIALVVLVIINIGWFIYFRRRKK